MATDKLTQGLPARIILETTIVQEEEVFKNSFDEMGRIVRMNNNYYLRFKESKEEDGVATLIKIEPEGVVHITRHTENKTRLIFDQDQITSTNYHTPAGIMQMQIKTNRISTVYSDAPFAGDIEIDYVIYMDEQPLGTYQIRLRFTT